MFDLEQQFYWFARCKPLVVSRPISCYFIWMVRGFESLGVPVIHHTWHLPVGRHHARERSVRLSHCLIHGSSKFVLDVIESRQNYSLWHIFRVSFV